VLQDADRMPVLYQLILVIFEVRSLRAPLTGSERGERGWLDLVTVNAGKSFTVSSPRGVTQKNNFG